MSNTSKYRQKIVSNVATNGAKSISAAKLRDALNEGASAIDNIFETLSLADGIGTFSATSGYATVRNTEGIDVSYLVTVVPDQANGKYFDVIVGGNTSVTGSVKAFEVGGKLVSRGTKWDYIPPSDLALVRVQTVEQLVSDQILPNYAFVWRDSAGKTAAFIDAAGSFNAFKWIDQSIPANAFAKFSGIDKIIEKSIQESLLSDDLLARVAKLLNVPGFKFVYRDETGSYPFAIEDNGTTIIAKLKALAIEAGSIPGSALAASSVAAAALSPDISAGVGKYKPLAGVRFAWDDVSGKNAMWIKDDGTVSIPKLSSAGLYQQKWAGKKMLCIGDSVTAAQKYQAVISEFTGMTVTTHAKGGIGLVQMVDGDGAATDPIAALTAAQLQDKDVVTVFGSLNDRTRLVGARTDMYPAQQTIYGRLNYVITKIYTLAASVNRKDIRIVLIAPHKVGRYAYIDADGGQEYPVGSGQTLQNIVDAIKDVAGFYGLPVVDLYRNSGINNFNWDILTLNTVSSAGPYPANPDNVHPNDAGHRLIGRYISSEINKL